MKTLLNSHGLLQPEYLSRDFRKHAFGHMRSVKIQISLHIPAVRLESSLGTFWIAKDKEFL